MARKQPPRFDLKKFLEKVGPGKSVPQTGKHQLIFSQGDAADAVFYIQTGQVKLTVLSEQSKEAVIAMPGAWELFRGRVPRRTADTHGNGDHRGKLRSCPH